MLKVVDTPVTNRGVQNTRQSGLRALVDWVQVTFKNATNCEEIVEFIGLNNSDFQYKEKGKYGYPESYVFGHIKLYFGARADMGIHLEISGQGCREYEQYTNIDWSVFFALIMNYDINFSRLDVAIDDFAKILNLKTMMRKYKKKVPEVTSKFKFAKDMNKTRLSDGSNCGSTIYFGEGESDIQVRFYDKLQERLGKGKEIEEGVDHWVRAEIQSRRDRASAIAHILAHEDYNIGQVVRGILKNYITFRNPKKSDPNKSRWPVSNFWVKFLDGVEKLPLTKVAPDRTIERSLNWVNKQVTPSIAMLFLALENDKELYNEYIKTGLEKFDTKHLDILNSYLKKEGKEIFSEDDILDKKIFFQQMSEEH